MNTVSKHPNHTWHQVQLLSTELDMVLHDRADVKKWCVEHFGPRWDVREHMSGDWHCVVSMEKPRGYRFMFRNQTDAVLFALRWL